MKPAAQATVTALGVALFAAGVAQAQSGAGMTTRYWDCCKQSCGWSQKAAVGQPVLSCDSAGSKLLNPDTPSGCDGGEAFTCTDNQPWAINDDLAYGFAAVSIAGSSEAQWCCECYELTFTSTAVEGKKLIVQATNTGGDLGANHFDLLIPGGGLGIFTEGCPAQFGSWNGGLQYGGVSSREDCNNLPASVQAGCFWRFDWFKNADNPSVNFTKTACPSELIAKSGCLRNDAAPPTTVTVTGTPLPGPTTTTTTVSSTLNSTVTTSTVPTATSPIPSDPSSSPSEPSPSPSPSPSDPGSVAQWGQCGGINYTGPTQCVSPFNCNAVNDYYSQCY